MSPKFFTRTNVSVAIIGLSLILMMLVAGGCAYVRRGETPFCCLGSVHQGP